MHQTQQVGQHKLNLITSLLSHISPTLILHFRGKYLKTKSISTLKSKKVATQSPTAGLTSNPTTTSPLPRAIWAKSIWRISRRLNNLNSPTYFTPRIIRAPTPRIPKGTMRTMNKPIIIPESTRPPIDTEGGTIFRARGKRPSTGVRGARRVIHFKRIFLLRHLAGGQGTQIIQKSSKVNLHRMRILFRGREGWGEIWSRNSRLRHLTIKISSSIRPSIIGKSPSRKTPLMNTKTTPHSTTRGHPTKMTNILPPKTQTTSNFATVWPVLVFRL